LKINSVGSASIWNCVAVFGFSSVFNFPTTYRPADAAAIWSMAGAIIRHGPHHAAQQSSSTGRSPAEASSESID
jgi:hypothetical protein